MAWIFPLLLLIFFELVADILAKEWSLNKPLVYAFGALLSYVIANTFWLFALKNGSGLARGAIIFSVASAVIATLLGVFVYKEQLTTLQYTGISLGIVSLFMIFWKG